MMLDEDRVRQIVREELEKFFAPANIKSKAPSCPHCNSDETNFMGESASGGRRVRCRNCGKTCTLRKSGRITYYGAEI